MKIFWFVLLTDNEHGLYEEWPIPSTEFSQSGIGIPINGKQSDIQKQIYQTYHKLFEFPCSIGIAITAHSPTFTDLDSFF